MTGWANIPLDRIIGGKNPDGSSMLESFLSDYSKEFSNTTLNAGCESCLQTYYNNYKTKQMKKQSTCEYTLHARFNGLPLAFGSQVLVTNSNITDEYAERIISRHIDIYEKKGETFDPSLFFEVFPDNWEDAHFEAEETAEEVAARELLEKQAKQVEAANAAKAANQTKAAPAPAPADKPEGGKQEPVGEAVGELVETTEGVKETPVEGAETIKEEVKETETETEKVVSDKDMKMQDLRKKYPEVRATSKSDFLAKLAEAK